MLPQAFTIVHLKWLISLLNVGFITLAGGYGFPIYGCIDTQGQSLLPMVRGDVEKIRDFAIAGYFGISWSIITEDHTYQALCR